MVFQGVLVWADGYVIWASFAMSGPRELVAGNGSELRWQTQLTAWEGQ